MLSPQARAKAHKISEAICSFATSIGITGTPGEPDPSDEDMKAMMAASMVALAQATGGKIEMSTLCGEDGYDLCGNVLYLNEALYDRLIRKGDVATQ